MSDKLRSPATAGVINPYALAEVKLGHQVDWPRVADRKRFLQTVLDCPYERLFDPKHGSPLYAGVRFDVHERALFHNPEPAVLISASNRLKHLTPNVLNVGGLGGTSQQWVNPGVFFTNSADFTAPVQGALPDCHFISAMAALAWSDPFAIMHATRPINNFADALQSGGAMDRIFFYNGTGAAPQSVEVTELLPLIEPGNAFQYARSGHSGETWPAVYEKAWVKWFTNDPDDRPDYTKVTGGDPIADLVSLTGKNYHAVATAGESGNQIWTAVRSHCRGSWTFDPMAACTYASSAAAPTPINYDTSGLVAWHCYAILGWQYVNGTEYIVLRNPWGYHEGTLNVDNGPWTSFDQFDGGDVVGSLSLPNHGVFALEANTFQQYFASYGWVD
jgi:calpain family cysteine protease